ncbi:MAG: sulfotransferase domain-containing protein [Bacteroidales bacterium]|nr:sulfotransferase domain-containing protein [Bacteroidales bacterium]
MNKEIFFHVGLSKTASTYLQNRFFNKIVGINYIGNHNYEKYHEIIEQSVSDKILVSREFDRQYNIELEKFAAIYPDAKIIIVLRQHDSWMASQYRRYLKNGGYKEFEQFFDIENNRGLWDIEDVLFYPKLQKINELFSEKPLVIFYEDIKKDIFAVFDQITKYTGTKYNREDINLTSKHKSYSEKQLKFVKKACRIFKNDYRSKKIILSRSRWLVCHLFLFIAAITPNFLFNKKPLINPESLEKVKEYFAEDWAKCKGSN